ncbi:MAG: GMC family oxidoreductase N-terminal domain-containing protein [Nocardioides sp.]|uniref:GMC family oxidoreductase n=1 Tax=Nocardioides sp. TaxID=35761 RepID=UPI0039E2E2FC
MTHTVTTAPQLRSCYEVVVVGGGSAGAAVAGRLSERGVQVCLLEAGEDWRSAALPDSLRHPFKQFELHVDELPSQFLWAGQRARRFAGGPPTEYLRGRGLGGTSTINGCFAIRPPLEEFDDWAAAGCKGWGAADVLPYFNRLENDVDFGDADYHGDAGPVPIVRMPRQFWGTVDQAVAQAAVASGLDWVPDYHEPGRTGASASAYNLGLGVRVTSNDGYLEPARQRSNLTIQGGALVDQVLVDHGRAVGVRALIGDEVHDIGADHVVLCGGTLLTPGVLLRSGIGPAEDLATLGRDVVADLPVGRRIQDHVGYEFGLVLDHGVGSLSGQRGNVTIRQTTGLGGAGDVIMTTVNVPQTGAPVGGLLCKVAECFSRGRLTVTDTDPRALPDVELDLLGDERDLAALRAMFRQAVPMLTAAIGETPLRAVLGMDGGELPAVDDDAAVDAWIRGHAHDTAHVSCSAPMGGADDEHAVVDTDLRVRGVDGLSVADLSVAPTIPRANTHLSAVMIGERAADLVTGARPSVEAGEPVDAADAGGARTC